MAPERVLSVLLTANGAAFRSEMIRASAEVARFGNNTEDASRRASASAATMKTAFAAVGVAVAAGIGYVANAAVDFDKSMRNVTSLSQTAGANAQAVETQFRGLSAEVLELSTQLPQSASVLAEGLYTIASSGFQGADGLQVLTASAQAASAGLTDTQTSATAISAVLNAYGLSAKDAGAVSDALFQTVNVGVISFQDLAQNVGDVVGAAAAAKVPIQDVGAAIATLTRAGAPAPEAFTQLNQLITHIVKPSENLALVIRKMGYESGLAAIQTDGLQGFMEKLRVSTGGNVETMLSLFTEIRAARGAQLLMSNEGKLYADAQNQVGDATQRTGQTQRTLAEQSKSVSFQLQLLRNRAMRPLLEEFSQGAPAAARFLGGLTDGLVGVGGGLEAVRRRAAPAFRELGDAMGKVWTLARNVVEELAPIAGLLLAIGGGAVLGGLQLLASVLGATAGFLNDNRVLVEALAIVWVGKYAAGVLLAARNTIYLKSVMAGVGVGMTGVSGATGVLGTALRNLPFFAAAAGALYLYQQFEKGKDSANSFVAALKQNYPSDSVENFSAVLVSLDSELHNVQDSQRDLNSQALRGQIGFAAWAKGLTDNAGSAKTLRDELQKTSTADINFMANQRELSRVTGLTGEQVTDLARKLGVDLTGAFEASGPGRQKVIDGFNAMGQQAGLSGSAIAQWSKGSIEAAAAMAEAIQKSNEGVKKSFSEAGDVVQAFGGKAGTTAGDIKKFYGDTIAQQENFLKNINSAMQRGLDPQLIARLLQAGPAQAGPVLQGILSDHSGRMIQMVNESEEKLRQLNEQAIYLNRITFLATQDSNNLMRTNAAVAMNIVVAEYKGGGHRSAEEIASELRIGVEEVLRISDQYGLNIVRSANQVQAALAQSPITFGQVPGKGAVATIRRAEGGISEAHSAEIAPGGAMRLWAEPETGGEAYIPLAPSKRGRSEAILETVAAKFGYALSDARSGGSNYAFADGGIYGSNPPWHFPPGAHTNTANKAMDHEWEMLVAANKALEAKKAAEAAAAAAAPGGPGAGGVGGSWQSIVAALSKTGIPFRVNSTTGGKHAPNSNHYRGKAVDLGGPNKMAIFNALLGSNLSELFYTPAGFSIKNGRRVPPIAASGHYSHVHAATYDRGGMLKPGWTMAYNGTGRSEHVSTNGNIAEQVGTAVERALANLPLGERKVVLNAATNEKSLLSKVEKALG